MYEVAPGENRQKGAKAGINGIVSLASVTLSDGQISFFSQLKHQVQHGYGFLNFISLATLSRTSHAMYKECHAVWMALAESKS